MSLLTFSCFSLLSLGAAANTKRAPGKVRIPLCLLYWIILWMQFTAALGCKFRSPQSRLRGLAETSLDNYFRKAISKSLKLENKQTASWVLKPNGGIFERKNRICLLGQKLAC